MKFEYLSHTADAKFRAFGKDIDEAFVNSALAMFNILGDTTDVKITKKIKIELKEKNYESLLYSFLEELLFLLETENLFLSNINNLKINKDFSLNCIVEGDDLQKYDLKGDIKAVTYSDMEIKKTNKGYEIVVVVDI
ncbi:archease [Candidatus Woesearchaeota archaeon]|jgi:SHS2 domain-containing protein|nr:archease [Candidatus Woesearchaeota archaeon]MBT4835415.1 archease [Candidatus Woesearchaeota archaeon]MBT6734893.1 archease [Candidatus Woesearchaeota archaeon]MBT7169592.1 archease [Candidatus Woesearchaeota archaeon]MBT7474550.1 archease [Candidatus Woesearchaeota archaeon]